MSKLVIDTETCGTLEQPFVYDIGFVILGKQNERLFEYRALVREVFYGMAEQMESAYYADKLPAYHQEIANKRLQVLPLARIREDLAQACKEYKVKTAWAFNAGFDKRALSNTVRKVSNGLQLYFMPYGIEWRDVWALACNTILNKRSFFKFVKEQNAYTPKDWPRTDAEITYRFITNNCSFIESHTALDDARIESVILARILARKGKTRGLGEIVPFPNRTIKQAFDAWDN